MIDTVHLEVKVTAKEAKRALRYLPDYRGRTGESHGSDFPALRYVKNFPLRIWPDKAILEGSLPKFWRGDNFKALTRDEIEEALFQLSESSFLDLSQAWVKRLDISDTFRVPLRVPEYFPMFVCPTGMDFYQRSTTLMFFNASRSLVFYDKIEELKYRKSRSRIPWERTAAKRVLADCEGLGPWLRFEVCYKQHPHTWFGMERILGKNLYDATFYRRMIDRWETEYEEIDKHPEKVKSLDFQDRKSMLRFLLMTGLTDLRADPIIRKIRALSKQREIKRYQAQRMRDAIYSILREPISKKSLGPTADLDLLVLVRAALLRADLSSGIRGRRR
jgi:hypothetical protein